MPANPMMPSLQVFAPRLPMCSGSGQVELLVKSVARSTFSKAEDILGKCLVVIFPEGVPVTPSVVKEFVQTGISLGWLSSLVRNQTRIFGLEVVILFLLWRGGTIKTSLLDFIDDHNLITGVYGDWPNFAGAYVTRVDIRSFGQDLDEYGGRQLTLTLHWWLTAPEHYPDAPRHYERSDLHRLVTIVFDAEDLHLRGFHCSDTSINSLELVPKEKSLLVKCSGGFNLDFTSFGAKVLSVLECDEAGECIEDN
ncbi:MAG: hypothetical protein KDB14_26300 [Planctomycetales bacterium]|nr:hypothetical protein [Planctomycetales bacterium]